MRSFLGKTRQEYYDTVHTKWHGLNRAYLYLRLLVCPFEIIEREIPVKAKTMLDVGAGYGIFADYIAYMRPKIRIAASEYNKARVEAARSKLSSNVHFVTKDAMRETFSGYDCITIIDVVHHIPTKGQELLFNKIKAQAKNGTTIIVKDIEKRPGFQYMWNWLHDIIMTRENAYYLSNSDFQSLFHRAGLKVIKTRRIKHPFYPHVLYVLRT